VNFISLKHAWNSLSPDISHNHSSSFLFFSNYKCVRLVCVNASGHPEHDRCSLQSSHCVYTKPHTFCSQSMCVHRGLLCTDFCVGLPCLYIFVFLLAVIWALPWTPRCWGVGQGSRCGLTSEHRCLPLHLHQWTPVDDSIGVYSKRGITSVGPATASVHTAHWVGEAQPASIN